MADFNNNTIVGTSGDNFNFVTNTRLWAGGGTAYVGTEDLRLDGGVTLTTDEATMIIQNGLWNHGRTSQGTYDFRNTVLDMHGMPANASGADHLTFENVTVLSTGQTGQTTWGNWGAGGGAVSNYDINGLNLWFNPVAGDNTLATCHFFITNTQGRYDNISLWNNTFGAGILGGTIGFRNFIVAGLTSGPIGSELAFSGANTAPGSGARVLYRMNVGAGQIGQMLSYDYRAIEGITGRWIFGHDDGGTTWQMNPLEGDPTTGGATGTVSFANPFNNANVSTLNRIIVQRPATVSGDIKFINGQAGAMYTIPEVLANTDAGSPQLVATNLVTHIGNTTPAAFGLGFLDSTISNNLNTSTAVVALTNKTYRTYSWQQDDWGTDRTINPTNPGATDAEVLADRTSGVYPEINATGVLTTFDVNESDDMVTAGFATHAEAIDTTTGLFRRGGATNPRDILASIKAAYYDSVTLANTAAGQSHENLPYSTNAFPATTLTSNLTLSATRNAATNTGNNLSVATGSIDIDTVETVTSLTAPTITLFTSGTQAGVASSENTKAALTSTGNDGIRLSGDQTINGLTASATGTGSINALGTTAGNLILNGVNFTSAGDMDLSTATITNSVLSTGGNLNIEANSITGTNSLTAATLTAGALEPTSRLLSDLTINAPYAFDTDEALAGITFEEVQWQSGAVTLPHRATFEGTVRIQGELTLTAGSFYIVDGPDVSFDDDTPTVTGTGNVTFQLINNATPQTLFGMAYVDNPSDNVIFSSDPKQVVIQNSIVNANTDVGRIYFNLRDQDGNTVPEMATASTNNYNHSGFSVDALGNLFIAQGGTGVINIEQLAISGNTWQLTTVGAGALDEVNDITYSTMVTNIIVSGDQNWTNTGTVISNDWAISVDRVQEIFNNTAGVGTNFTAGNGPFTLAVTPEAGTTATDITLDGLPDGVNITNLTGNTFSLTGVGAAADDVWSVVYAGDNASQFGIRIPLGGADISGFQFNHNVGLFKSNQDYADYVGTVGFRDDGVTRGIHFPTTAQTQFYFNGPTDGQAVLETQLVVELDNMSMHSSGATGWTSGFPQFVPGSTTRVRALTNMPTAEADVRIHREEGGVDVLVTETTLNGFIDNQPNGFGAFDQFRTNPNWAVGNAAWEAGTGLRAIPFSITRQSTGVGPDGNFILAGWGTNNAPFTGATTSGTGAATGEVVIGLAIEWDLEDFSDADIAEYGLDPSATGYAAANFFGTGGSGGTQYPVSFTRRTEVSPNAAPPTRTYVQTTIDIPGATPFPVPVRGAQSFVASSQNTANFNIADGTVLQLDDNTQAADFNTAAVDGQTVRIIPLDEDGDPVTDAALIREVLLGLEAAPASADSFDYNLVRANALSAIQQYNPSTTFELDNATVQITDELDVIETTTKATNERVQSINAGDASKIPPRRPFDPTSYTPE